VVPLAAAERPGRKSKTSWRVPPPLKRKDICHLEGKSSPKSQKGICYLKKSGNLNRKTVSFNRDRENSKLGRTNRSGATGGRGGELSEHRKVLIP